MSEENHKGERIAKRIARAGICSRRDAEKRIEQGRVHVNGKVIDSPALNITDKDKIKVDGKALPDVEHTRLFLYHKPPGLVTTHKDERDRSTVFDELPEHMPRVVSVGRLDLNTEGLLLLTNDGGLSRFLELPTTGWKRKYRVRVNGKVNEKRLKSLKNGITVEGVRYKSIDAVLEATPEGKEGTSANSWITITITEGKNREIRRVMEALGLRVTRLIRTDYGPFTLGKMNRGVVEEVSERVLKTHLSSYMKDKGIEKPSETELRKPKGVRGKNSNFSKNGNKNDPKNKKFDKNRSQNSNFSKKDKR